MWKLWEGSHAPAAKTRLLGAHGDDRRWQLLVVPGEHEALHGGR